MAVGIVFVWRTGAFAREASATTYKSVDAEMPTGFEEGVGRGPGRGVYAALAERSLTEGNSKMAQSEVLSVGSETEV